MKTIKELKKNGYKLTHSLYTDEITGVITDGLSVLDEETGTHYPFTGKVTLATAPIPHTISEYTDADYEEMLDSQIQTIERHKKVSNN